MCLTISPFVARIWMPALFLLMTGLVLHDAPVVYWLLYLPVLLACGLMNTLAQVERVGDVVVVDRWWGTMRLKETEVVDLNPAWIEGIGLLRAEGFIFPFGRVLFVPAWSGRTVAGVEQKVPQPRGSDKAVRRQLQDIGASIAMAVSGFFSARAIGANASGFQIQHNALRAAGILTGGVLVAAFVLLRRDRPGAANAVLFAGTWMIGLVTLR